ncbi:copper resistance CopC family protein [Microbacterium sp. bgisy203]|uniref:copper resistance CopC family protein n=1 Tax=Microbacterium sp. bgisy203 TaxID=3413799 RepID=UPI003D74BEE1
MSQGIHTPRPLARLGAAATALLAALALVLLASPAYAHDELIGSDPASGAQVDALPAEITLTFSGVLLDEPGAAEVVVTDAAGTDLTASDPVLDGTRLTQPLQGDASGEVTVIWRVVSSDGHPVSDQFTFTVGDGSAVAPTGTAPSPTETAPASDDEGVSPAVWIGVGVAIFASLIGVFAVTSSANRRRRED